MFASIHVPDFSLEAIVRHQPELRHQRVVVVDGKPPLLTVIALNALARSAGMEFGMTKFQVEQFYDAVIRPRSAMQEASAHAALLDCASGFSPRVEETSTDTVVLDIEGSDRLFGSTRELAQGLSDHLAAAGLMGHVAIASNPDTAICASHGWSGITVIEPGSETQRLKNLGIAVLAAVFGMDAETHGTLQRWGIHTLGALGKLPAKALAQRLGQSGVHLHQLARGRVFRPLVPRKESLHFEESIELDYSIPVLEPLTFLLNRLCDALFHRLRSRGLAAQGLYLKLRRERPHDLFILPLQLPIPAQNPRVVTKLFMLALEAHPPGAPVIGVQIEAIPATPRVIQNGLFVPLSPEPEKLELTLARIASVVGNGNVGSPELANTHARDRFVMKHFGNGMGIVKCRLREPGKLAALRLFRPAVEATTQTRDGIPKWIAFSGVHGAIETASGPWHGSGDWWNSQHWNREEWDIAIAASSNPHSAMGIPQFLLSRIYRDVLTNRWYVEGIYD